MRTSTCGKWIGYAAVVLATVGAGRAFGQYRVDNSHANDANNQVNSGGYNSGTHYVNPGSTGQNNAVVEQNAPGLQNFLGAHPNEDLRGFAGAGPIFPSESLNRNVGGPNVTPDSYGTPAASYTSTPYYDSSRFIAPPQGFVAVPGGGYVQGPPPTPSPNDVRLGAFGDSTFVVPPSPDEAIMPGQVSLAPNQSVLTESVLYGVKQWHMDQNGNLVPDDQQNAMGESTLFGTQSQPPMFGSGGPLTRDRVNQIRAEFNNNNNSASGTPENPNGPTDSNNPGTNPPAANPMAPANGAAPSGSTATNNQPGARLLDQKPLPAIQPAGGTPMYDGRVASGVQIAPTNGRSVNTGQRNDFAAPTLVEPARQSTQYQALEKALADYERQKQNPNLTDEERYQLTQKENQAVSQLTKPGTTDIGGRGTGRGGISTGGPTTGPTPPRNTSVAPVQIPDLSSGTQSRGLAEILRDAETLVRQGKYKEAIDQYNNASIIVPNNPLIQIYRANAELGANLYVRAEGDLRDAYGRDTALMMGKFDLVNLIGQKRLDAIAADLEDLANTNQTSETPVFLLAYVDYNTDQISKVAGRLELAERLAGGRDPLIDSLFQHWNLTAATQPAAGK